MIRVIDGVTWFCCPVCGKKLHPVERGARGVFAACRGKLPDGSRCAWRGEVKWLSEEEICGGGIGRR